MGNAIMDMEDSTARATAPEARARVDVSLLAEIPAVGGEEEVRAYVDNANRREAMAATVAAEVDAMLLAGAFTDGEPEDFDAEVERRLDAEFGVVGARVGDQVRDMEAALGRLLDGPGQEARAAGVMASESVSVEVLPAGSRLERAPDTLAERVRVLLGRGRGLAWASHGDLVRVSVEVSFVGPRSHAERLGREVADGLARAIPGGAAPKLTSVDLPPADGLGHEERRQRRLAGRTPLPPTGAAVMACLGRAWDALGAGDAASAFGAADEFVALARRDAAVANLLLCLGKPGGGSPRFEVGNPRRLSRHLADTVGSLKARGDVAGLGALLFSHDGVFQTLGLTVRYEAVPGRAHAQHARHVASAFGDAGNAEAHFEAMTDGRRGIGMVAAGPARREVTLADGPGPELPKFPGL